MKFLIALLLSLGLQAHADLNYDQLQQSVFKVYKMDTTGRPVMVASSFAVNYNSATYLITNNHVCFGLAGPGKSYIKVINGRTNDIKKDYDEITDVSPMPSSDVCVIKTKGYHPGLPLAVTPAQIHQPVTVFGYIGRSDYSMPTSGYMYEQDEVDDYAGLRNCKDFPPHALRNKLICWFFDKYSMMTSSPVSTANVNVGPGYSGSPVSNNNGEVVGIIARYIPASKLYSNGDGIFYDVNYIAKAITTAKFEPVGSPELAEKAQIVNWSNELLEWREDLEDLYDE